MTKGGTGLELDHYLEVFTRKPGAFPGATVLERARIAGTFTPTHDAWWAAVVKVHGDADGTRELIRVLLLHRRMRREDVVAGIAAALKVAALTADAVALEAAGLPADTLVGHRASYTVGHGQSHALKGVDLIERGAEVVQANLDIEAGLQVEPEPVGGAEVAGQAQRGVGGDSAFAVNDLVDPTWGAPLEIAKGCWVTSKRVRKSSRRTLPGWIGAMVVIGVPPLTRGSRRSRRFGAGGVQVKQIRHLLVDADAVLSGAVTAKGFEPVAGRDSQVIESPGGIGV